MREIRGKTHRAGKTTAPSSQTDGAVPMRLPNNEIRSSARHPISPLRPDQVVSTVFRTLVCSPWHE